jgi:molybdopterin converting factor small subunit
MPVTESSSPAGVEGAAGSSVTVLVRYFAAARAAAGSDEESVTVDSPATVAAVIDAITVRHGEALARVLTRCSYLLGATAVHELSTPVSVGDQLDVLPPFAGG